MSVIHALIIEGAINDDPTELLVISDGRTAMFSVLPDPRSCIVINSFTLSAEEIEAIDELIKSHECYGEDIS